MIETPDASIHHFVLSIKVRPTDPDTTWTKTIREYQQVLKCMICGIPDIYSFRLAIQCSAGDTNEDPTFRATHIALRPSETCYCAMHVGCAVWGRNDGGELPHNRRVYFFPGLAKIIRRPRQQQQQQATMTTTSTTATTTTTRNPTDEAMGLTAVTRVYCPVHAAELQLAKVVGADIVRYPAHVRPYGGGGGSHTDTAVSRTRDDRKNMTTTTTSRTNQTSTVSTTAATATNNRMVVRHDPVRNRLGLLDPVPRPIIAKHSSNRASTSRISSVTASATSTTTRAVPPHRRSISETWPAKRTDGTMTSPHRPLASLVQTIQHATSTSLSAATATAITLMPITTASTLPDPKRVRRTASKNTIIPTHLKHPQYLKNYNNPKPPPPIHVRPAPNNTSDIPVQDTTTTTLNTDPATLLHDHSESLVWTDDDADDDHNVIPPSTAETTEQEPHPTPPPTVSNDELIQQMINEIVAKEEMGGNHLDYIFEETKQHWKDQLLMSDGGASHTNHRNYNDFSYDEFQTLWSQVIEYCLEEKFPYYSLVRTNWKGTGSSQQSLLSSSSMTTTNSTNDDSSMKHCESLVVNGAPHIIELETMELITLEDVMKMTTNETRQRHGSYQPWK